MLRSFKVSFVAAIAFSFCASIVPSSAHGQVTKAQAEKDVESARVACSNVENKVCVVYDDFGQLVRFINDNRIILKEDARQEMSTAAGKINQAAGLQLIAEDLYKEACASLEKGKFTDAVDEAKGAMKATLFCWASCRDAEESIEYVYGSIALGAIPVIPFPFIP